MKKIKIAVTSGDPAGIGPEICCKIIDENFQLRDVELYFVGLREVFDLTFSKVLKRKYGEFNIIEPDLDINIKTIAFGEIKAEYGKIAMKSVEKAVKLCLSGEIDAVVTCPINKKSIQLAGYQFPGHTEFLGFLTNSKDFSMMLAAKQVKVVLVTTHLPIKDISKHLTKENIKRAIKNAIKAGKFFGTEEPSVAVCGLNPHAGDNGALGDEEQKIIEPAIKEIKSNYHKVYGPFAADSLFPKVLKGEYDIVVCMYHDQGLIPVKMEGFGSAVNITLNLPIIRTSVDHGTGFDIAGKGVASSESLKRAIEKAAEMVRNVKSY